MNNHRIELIEKRLDALEKRVSVDESQREPDNSKSLWDEILATILLLEADQKPSELADAIIELLEERGFV